MKLAIIPNSNKIKAIEYAKEIIEYLSDFNCDFSIPDEFENKLSADRVTYFPNHYQTVKNADIVIAIGGDATIIHAAKHAAEMSKPVLGVNFGRVGFVANLEPRDLHLLSKLFDGDYQIDERMMLDITIESNGKISEYCTLNDVTISRGALSRMVELDVDLNGEFISTYRADGLLLSTPTGSTAYSLSAGGPVIEPHMKCILLTPICPHSLFSRSVLFSDDSVVKVTPHNELKSDLYVTMDGNISVKLESKDVVTVKKSESTANFIKLTNKNFYRILNDKLNERRT